MNDNMRNIGSGSSAGSSIRAEIESKRIEHDLLLDLLKALHEQTKLLQAIASNTGFICEKLNEKAKQNSTTNVSSDHT